ncbi:MAG: class I SAM-dependent methyltransferase [Planctomycetota bacterium]
MLDRLGRRLTAWRIRAVLPWVRGRLLDIGCGTNGLVGAYAGDGVGVDVHPWPGVDRVVEDSAHLPFETGAFSTVTILAALNHIPNRREVLAEARRLLGDGGRIIITMIPPRISRLWHTLRRPWDCDQGERGMKDGEVFGLSGAEVRDLLIDAGFAIEATRRFMLGINCVTIGTTRDRTHDGSIGETTA